MSQWPNLSGGETLDLLLRMRGVDPHATRKNELLGRLAWWLFGRRDVQ